MKWDKTNIYFFTVFIPVQILSLLPSSKLNRPLEDAKLT